MRRLHSTQWTIVERVPAPTRESLTNETIAPHPALYTRDFARLMLKPPFLVNISGIVSMVQDETFSAAGDPMLMFRLTDSGGRYVQCRAFGRHVANEHIDNGTEVVLYFVTAQRGLNNQPGQLWIYDEAHIVSLQTGCAIPDPRQLIELRDV